MKEIKKSKFNLDKFEVAKLVNPKKINGGGGDDDPGTITNTVDVNNSGLRCKKDIKQPPLNQNLIF